VIGNSLWCLVAQSDSLSIIILLLLLGASILSWTAAIFKISILWSKNRQMSSFYHAINETRFTFEELIKYLAEHEETVGSFFMAQQLGLFSLIFNQDVKQTDRQNALITEMIDNGLYQSIDDWVMRESRVLSLFATIAGVAPLLGLLGTVWGLIHAFMRISQTQVADIATIAPGISEALITTLAGLMVAIPALIMFNYISTQVKIFEQHLERLADRYRILVHMFFLRNFDASSAEKKFN
jgi:biopolymer transport protein TolQ